MLEESRRDFWDGEDPNDEALAKLRELRREIAGLKLSKKAKSDLDDKVADIRRALREPAVAAHVGAERLARHVTAMVSEARMEVMASVANPVEPALSHIDVGGQLALGVGADDEEAT